MQALLADKPHEHRDPNFKEQPVPTFEIAEGFEITLWPRIRCSTNRSR